MSIAQKIAILEMLVADLIKRIELLEDVAGMYKPATSLEHERSELELMEREAKRVIRPLEERSVPGVVMMSRAE